MYSGAKSRRRDVIGATKSVTKFGASHLVGADKVYTDSATVTQVQAQLHALSLNSHNPSLDPGKIDGKIGPNTNAAVAAFNVAYGWPTDGSSITDGTLVALKRPDVIDPAGYAAQQAAASADAASTPTQVQSAAAQLSLLTGISSPAIQSAIASAQNAAITAKTPAEVADAKVKIKAAAHQAQGSSLAPTLAIVGAGALALTGIIVMVVKSHHKGRR